jgi:hypothetical protein
MKKINIHYVVKFRVFGITLGIVEGIKPFLTVPIGVPIPLPTLPVVDERGVTIWITEE